MNIYRLILLVYFISFLPESQALESFCFKRNINILKVKSYLSPVLLTKDAISLDQNQNCLEISLSENRKYLFEKYLRRKYRFTTTSYTQNYRPRLVKNCRIEIEKHSSEKSRGSELKAKRRGYAKAFTSNGKRVVKSQILAGNNHPAILNVSGQNTYIKCILRGKNTYELHVSLSEKRGGFVSTTITVNRGQKMNIGSVIDELKNKSKSIDIKNGAHYDKIKKTTDINFFATVLN